MLNGKKLILPIKRSSLLAAEFAIFQKVFQKAFFPNINMVFAFALFLCSRNKSKYIYYVGLRSRRPGVRIASRPPNNEPLGCLIQEAFFFLQETSWSGREERHGGLQRVKKCYIAGNSQGIRIMCFTEEIDIEFKNPLSIPPA